MKLWIGVSLLLTVGPLITGVARGQAAPKVFRVHMFVYKLDPDSVWKSDARKLAQHMTVDTTLGSRSASGYGAGEQLAADARAAFRMTINQRSIKLSITGEHDGKIDLDVEVGKTYVSDKPGHEREKIVVARHISMSLRVRESLRFDWGADRIVVQPDLGEIHNIGYEGEITVEPL